MRWGRFMYFRKKLCPPGSATSPGLATSIRCSSDDGTQDRRLLEEGLSRAHCATAWASSEVAPRPSAASAAALVMAPVEALTWILDHVGAVPVDPAVHPVGVFGAACPRPRPAPARCQRRCRRTGVLPGRKLHARVERVLALDNGDGLLGARRGAAGRGRIVALNRGVDRQLQGVFKLVFTGGKEGSPEPPAFATLLLATAGGPALNVARESHTNTVTPRLCLRSYAAAPSALAAGGGRLSAEQVYRRRCCCPGCPRRPAR